MSDIINNEQLISSIAKELKIKKDQIIKVLELLDEGNTVPFIARYRKEVTGALNEDQIRTIYKEYEYRQNLAKRKEDVIRLISEKGKMTDTLKEKIIKADKLSDVEDLYRPYKEKKKTRATMAKKKGLEPFANWMLEFPIGADVEKEAEQYISEEKEVEDIEEAIQGAKDIIAEIASDNADFRKYIKHIFFNEGSITTKVKDESKDERKVYEMYYDYHEPVKSVVPHRILAMNRGEKEKVLKVSLEEPFDKIIHYLETQMIQNSKSEVTPYIKSAIEDGYKRLLKNSIEREIRSELKDKAEDQAINIFSENVRNLLLQPPMKGKVVLGVDPAFRTGCKLAVVNDTGKVLDISVIYPHEKYKGETIKDDRVSKAKKTVQDKLIENNVEIIAIGNGTASRETEAFIVDTIKNIQQDVSYLIVSEAGASVYSASTLAKKEFPKLQVEERSAISIARRLQDPLAELVKIDPKSIGVGQYQHDVTQSKLNDSLNFVVETAVNQVGVNVNTASPALLKYVSGCNASVAKKIVAFRDDNGRFTNRDQLLNVKGFGPKSFEQAIGFLRILDGDRPLDKTPIHPESYDAALKILDSLGFTEKDLGRDELKLAVRNVDRNKFQELTGLGEHTLNDILDALIAPNRDMRDKFSKPLLKKDVLKLEDLKEDMIIEGTVRNVVDFGAFVDCGVKVDGLVHISKLSKSYVKHPTDLVSVGDIVKVKVIDVDTNKQRLALSMIVE
ncbi:Tex family protein [Haloplasma contractile]|uniref:S1 RNA binding domain protein n=1 Tax=Haloplasma contractile SSD-17B TaxID=1033810 RepID=U2FD74_9MOLU|nr:Tex family protein [Haloplasma contractile]ERJ10950.1 S1 RNA binding domain protein [Haloplasma contractile SSD-17B]